MLGKGFCSNARGMAVDLKEGCDRFGFFLGVCSMGNSLYVSRVRRIESFFGGLASRFNACLALWKSSENLGQVVHGRECKMEDLR